MTVTTKSFGEIGGQEVLLYTLSNSKGMELKLTSYGARIIELSVPDKRGNSACITTGFKTLDPYLKGEPYFGCTVGRVANRIANGKFTLDGKTYTLATNNGPNSLHGGIKGFDKQVWKTEMVKSGSGGICFTYLSPDREEGFPGNLKTTATYTLQNQNELTVEFLAETDAPTIVNLTNHAYFNLKGAGQGTILDHQLQLDADYYTPVSEALIPTGELKSVQGTPFDFRTPYAIGARISEVGMGYDHNFALNQKSSKPAAKLYEPSSGRVMEIYTSQPGIQLYTGNFLDGSLNGIGGTYAKHSALCLETQHFPDAVNQAKFPSVVLRPGQKYQQVVRYCFSVA